MPCRDVSETLVIEFNSNGGLHHYRLRKATCGAIVGAESLLLPWLLGMRCEQIVRLDSRDLLARWPKLDDGRSFIYLKHLLAIRDTLETYMGERNGTALSSIELDKGGALVLTARINVAVVAQRVRSCGGCGSCDKKTAQSDRLVGLNVLDGWSR